MISEMDRSSISTNAFHDLAREVYCILGLPVDAIELDEVLQRLAKAAHEAAPFVMSTPNLNFLVNSQADPAFRESMLISNLCPADGVPIVWIARLLGIPIRGRLAGSDIFDALKARHPSATPLKVFLFGGPQGIAAKACNTINEQHSGVRCVGALCPGFGSIDEMSQDTIIQAINASHADFLVVALGAKKGQHWLLYNHNRLTIPLRSHLGAVINFQANAVKRAPSWVRRCGLEWLWRIKEEPYLWQRYWHDAIVLIRLLFTRVLPLAIRTRLQQIRYARGEHDLAIENRRYDNTFVFTLRGLATARQVQKAIPMFTSAVGHARNIVIDLSGVRVLDARFLGLILMLRKCLKEQGATLTLARASPTLRKLIRLHCVEFLLVEK